MRTFKSITRSKNESTGIVLYVEDGVEKGARFDKSWTDDTVLKHFGITKPAESEPVAVDKKGKATK